MRGKREVRIGRDMEWNGMEWNVFTYFGWWWWWVAWFEIQLTCIYIAFMGRESNRVIAPNRRCELCSHRGQSIFRNLHNSLQHDTNPPKVWLALLVRGSNQTHPPKKGGGGGEAKLPL